MIILRKGKKTILQAETAYQIAEMLEDVPEFAGQDLTGLQRSICQNAFGFCIPGAKARIGGGYRIENKAD